MVKKENRDESDRLLNKQSSIHPRHYTPHTRSQGQIENHAGGYMTVIRLLKKDRATMKQKKPTYPPTPGSYQTSPNPIPRRKRQSALKTLYSSLYHATFALFILIVASLLVGSAYGLGQQAVRTGGQRRWNLFVLIAAYVALVGLVVILSSGSSSTESKLHSRLEIWFIWRTASVHLRRKRE